MSVDNTSTEVLAGLVEPVTYQGAIRRARRTVSRPRTASGAHRDHLTPYGPIEDWTHSFPSKITPLYETKDTFDIEGAQLIVRAFRIGLRPLLGGGETVFFFGKFSNLAPYGDKVSFGDLNGRPSSCFLADHLISFSRQFLNFLPRIRDFTFRSLDRRFSLCKIGNQLLFFRDESVNPFVICHSSSARAVGIGMIGVWFHLNRSMLALYSRLTPPSAYQQGLSKREPSSLVARTWMCSSPCPSPLIFEPIPDVASPKLGFIFSRSPISRRKGGDDHRKRGGRRDG
jgi:hypothetical protein